jgi:nucleotide-binding universal stress UspA family protein
MEPKPSAVVVAYDFSSFGQAVLDRAVALVTRAPFHVLHFVTVVDPHKNDPSYVDRVRDALAKAVGKALAASPIANEVQFHVHPRIGKPADEILQLAQEIGADLILIGTHGHTGLTRLMMGSVAEHVVREAGCAVLVARPKTYADVELMHVVEVVRTRPTTSRHTYSYSNKADVTRPPDWPLQ